MHYVALPSLPLWLLPEVTTASVASATTGLMAPIIKRLDG